MIYGELLLIGLFGSMHCIGMCGGFVGMYSLKKPQDMPVWPYHLLYNAGRIVTYVLLGGLLGTVGSFTAFLGRYRFVPSLALLVGGSLMVLIGFKMAGIGGILELGQTTDLSRAPLFRKILHHVLSIRSVWGTFLLGLLLGFLPCGLLYPVLIRSAFSGGVFQGAATALSFGIGTVPSMVSFGYLITQVRPYIRLRFYRMAALLIVLIGCQTILRGLSFAGMVPHSRFW
jgi:sulfite exporter TauE/SafE